MENKIFTAAQNGFRKGKCIETAIQSFTDLTKAYDILKHDVLLEKLSSYAIRGTANSWIKSYLTNRRQFVEINQSDSSNVRVNRYRSSFMEIKQGVPQGSVVGLLFFLLYINDLPSSIHGTKLVMFADDINVLVTNSDVCALQSKIDRVIAELESWFNRNNLVINVGKTVVMSLHNRQIKFPVKPQVIFNKMNLVYTAETKFLGIYVTETLNWNSHVQSLAAKFSQISYMMKSLKETLSQCMI
jgi:hypothetical protein